MREWGCELAYGGADKWKSSAPGGKASIITSCMLIAHLSHCPGAMVCIVSKERYTDMPGQKVLVVDDSWTELTMIATPLRNSGFDVVTAVDGDEAMEKVFRERPQCIVLKGALPRRKGFQSCRRWRGFDQGRHIQI